MAYQLGLDTGGTYTDAVLVDEALNVVDCAKSLTTHANLIEGLQGAVRHLLTPERVKDITLVSLSTTLATNALVEGRGRPVALVLIGFTPAQLKRANLADALAGDPHVFIDGGHDAGGRAVSALDLKACEAFIKRVDARVDAYAVSGVFAVRNPTHELQLQELITSLTGKPVTCGHHLSSGLDAPRRALTALLNARLIPMITALMQASRKLLSDHAIDAPLMVVKGDGSLISDEMALNFPVETILSGPAASVVGAQFLCKRDTLLVSDMGGTTTDVAFIRDAQPKLNPDGATVGGWRTMVKAVDVRTFGLGGDSAVHFHHGEHRFALATQRVMPLSLLISQHPELLEELEAQLALPFSTTHSAQFVMTHGPAASDLSLQQRELYEQIQGQPVSVQSLFSDQTLERALSRLEQRGVVLRAGFTPSDACHVLGTQQTWDAKGAILGARLLMRYAENNLGERFDSEQAFAESVLRLVAQDTAMVLLDTAASANTPPSTLTASQQCLIRASLQPESEGLLSLRPRLNVPVIGLGAPAASYYAQAAALLQCDLELPEFAHVANALGAVVGTVRQEHAITITPAGGKRVSVLLKDGPELFDDLDSGAVAARQWCEAQAREKALQAGAEDVTVTFAQHDTIVRDGDQDVFFESFVTATAVGRPSSSH